MPSTGCTIEIIRNDGSIGLDKSHQICFSRVNEYIRDGCTLNTFEVKVNISSTEEEIKEYLSLLKVTKLFLDIEFIPDFSDTEYKFVIKVPSNTNGAKLKGTYTVLRYLWGDCYADNGGNQFHKIIPPFLKLAKKYPRKDRFMLLAISHSVLGYYNSNHCLLMPKFKLMTKKDVIFDPDSMNYTYSGHKQQNTPDEKLVNSPDRRALLNNLDLEGILKHLENNE